MSVSFLKGKLKSSSNMPLFQCPAVTLLAAIWLKWLMNRRRIIHPLRSQPLGEWSDGPESIDFLSIPYIYDISDIHSHVIAPDHCLHIVIHGILRLTIQTLWIQPAIGIRSLLMDSPWAPRQACLTPLARCFPSWEARMAMSTSLGQAPKELNKCLLGC